MALEEDSSADDDGILAAYHALRCSGEGGREEASERIRLGLEEVVRQLSQEEEIPVNSPEYAEIAHELGFDGLREALDQRHREVTKRAIRRRLSQIKREKKQTEEQLRQYILPRLEKGILGEVLRNPRTEVDTPTGRVDIFAEAENGIEVIVELKGEDWAAANSAKQYELVGQVSTYFNELDIKTHEARAILVLPEFPQRVYDGLLERIRAGRINAFTFTVDGESYTLSPVDFNALEQQLKAASSDAFRHTSPWVRSMKAAQEEAAPDTIGIGELVPKGRARRRRRKQPADYIEGWKGAEVTAFVHDTLRRFYADDNLVRLARYYITALGVLNSMPGEIVMERCDGFLTRIMHENPSVLGVDEWYESFDDFLVANERGLMEYRKAFEEAVDGTLPFVRYFMDQPGDVSKGADLMDRIGRIIGRYEKAPRSIKAFASVFEKAAERLLQKLKTTGLNDEENLILEDIVTWNLGHSEFHRRLSIYSFRNTVMGAALLSQVDPELAACYVGSMKGLAEGAALGSEHLKRLVGYKKIIDKLSVAEPTEQLMEMEDRVRNVLSRMGYEAGRGKRFGEYVEEWQGAEVDRDTYKHLRRLSGSSRLKVLVEAKNEYEASRGRTCITPGLLTIAYFVEKIIPGLPKNRSVAKRIAKRHPLLLDKQKCAEQGADYLERLNRGSEEYSAALEGFWEQPSSGIAALEDALSGVTDICNRGCPARNHLILALDSSVLSIERTGSGGERFPDLARTIRHEQDETLRKLNLEAAWIVLGRYKALLQVDGELAVRYVRSQAALLEIDTGMDMEALEMEGESYGRILSKIRVKENPKPAPAYRPPALVRSQPKVTIEPSLDPGKYSDDVYAALIRDKRKGDFPAAIQDSAMELAIYIADSEALKPSQKLEIREQLAHFRGKDPLNKLLHERMPDEGKFNEFARQMMVAVDNGTVPDVHGIYSTTMG